jgi:hypothetical protein
VLAAFEPVIVIMCSTKEEYRRVEIAFLLCVSAHETDSLRAWITYLRMRKASMFPNAIMDNYQVSFKAFNYKID